MDKRKLYKTAWFKGQCVKLYGCLIDHDGRAAFKIYPDGKNELWVWENLLDGFCL